MPEPPVTVDGVRVHDDGLSLVRETPLLNPFDGEMVMVEVAGTPTTADTLVGLAVIEKSAVGAWVTVAA